MVFFWFLSYIWRKGSAGMGKGAKGESGVPGLKSHGVELLATALRLN